LLPPCTIHFIRVGITIVQASLLHMNGAIIIITITITIINIIINTL